MPVVYSRKKEGVIQVQIKDRFKNFSKSITIRDTSVDEVYKIILRSFNVK